MMKSLPYFNKLTIQVEFVAKSVHFRPPPPDLHPRSGSNRSISGIAGGIAGKTTDASKSNMDDPTHFRLDRTSLGS